MKYNFDINNRAFKALKNGTKRVEIRVTKLENNHFDYGVLKSGDLIEFKSYDGESITCRVKDVNHYDSIEELLTMEGTRYTLSSTNDFNEGVKSINSIDGYKDAMKVNGVYAIHIEYPKLSDFIYEYKSKKKIKNIPLVHINVGRGRKARGIIAIGNNAKGLIAIGGKSVGLFSVGGLSLGLISIGGIGFGLFTIAGLALALLMSIGGISISSFAIGGIAIGIVSLGGISIGLYSVGGYSIGRFFSLGGYAKGHIAIGHHASGDIILTKPTRNEVRKIILDNYPRTWKIILDYICNFFESR